MHVSLEVLWHTIEGTKTSTFEWWVIVCIMKTAISELLTAISTLLFIVLHNIILFHSTSKDCCACCGHLFPMDIYWSYNDFIQYLEIVVQVVVISFQWIYTDPYNDFISVFDGYDNTSSIIIVLSGYEPPRQPFYSTSQTIMFLQFTSMYCCPNFYATFYSTQHGSMRSDY